MTGWQASASAVGGMATSAFSRGAVRLDAAAGIRRKRKRMPQAASLPFRARATGCGALAPSETVAAATPKEEDVDHADTVRGLYAALNAGDLDGFGAMLADDFVEHEETPGLAPTKAGVLEFFRMYRAAFPDLQMEPQDVLASGDKVVARVRATGTHQGEFMGMPPSGKNVDVQLIDIIRFDGDGLAREHWGVVDLMTMMQQLGAIPEGPPA